MTTTEAKTLQRVTIEDILQWGPCYTNAEKRLNEIAENIGQNDINALEALDLDIPAEDRLWAVLREEMMPVELIREAACQFAESVLHIFEGKHPDDKRPREAIEAARRFNRGEITDAAANAAWSAAANAANAAAANAAWSAANAAWSAAANAAWSPAANAAWSAAAEKRSQIQIVKNLLASKG